MPDVVFPNDGDGGGPRMMLVAIGPEGEWEEPHKLDMFKRSGFQRVLLGSRVLRSDVRS
jgi:16S rRNA U1498 N3-methylase RsmE